jgi:DmsE family decaheme c-type cytochrome
MILRKMTFGLLTGLAIALIAGACAAAEAQPAAYAPDGAATCLKCHDRGALDATAIFKTPHGVKGDSHTPFAQNGCETCHGASPAHYKATPAEGEKRPSPAVVFKGENASPVAERNKVCLGCHENGLRMDWKGSQHEGSQVACTNCHTVHVQKDPVLVKASQPDKCFTCHAARRADAFKFSHHPIEEGKVVCSDCHNPHGAPGPKLLKEANVNETCYTCHAEKRGPFLWEHEAVRDDCMNCHNPHGSNEARLLKTHLPFLCTNCHSDDTHKGASWNGNMLPGNAVTIPAAGSSAGAVLNNTGAVLSAISPRLLDRGCVNCHSQIHGSNSPAGNYFNR